jgi:hypothetical protein
MYAVVLQDFAAEQLAPVVTKLMKKAGSVSFFKATRVEPNGAYFLLVLEDKTPGGKDIEFELQIPHSAVLAVFYAADLKRMGFV